MVTQYNFIIGVSAKISEIPMEHDLKKKQKVLLIS